MEAGKVVLGEAGIPAVVPTSNKDVVDEASVAGPVTARADDDGTKVTRGTSLTVAELASLLQINMSASSKVEVDIGVKSVSSMISSSPMTLQVIDKVSDVVGFHRDTYARYTLMEYLPEASMKFNDFESWLKEVIRVSVSQVEKSIVVYRIDKRIDVNDKRVIPLDVLGVESNLSESTRSEIPGIRSALLTKQTPNMDNGRYDRIYVGCHPKLAALRSEIQEQLFTMDAAPLAQWIRNFTFRKELQAQHYHENRGGDPNAQWYAPSSPRNLPELLGILPHCNIMHITHSAPFSMPELELSDVNLSALSQDMEVTTTKASALGSFLSMPLSSVHMQDIKNILLSWIFPTQVQVYITIDKTESTVMLGFYSIIAKLMLSNSPGCRNVTTNSIHLVNDLIERYLLHEGLTRDANDAGVRNQQAVRLAWDALIDVEDGEGWLNHGVDATRDIGNPLYVGVTELPVYGGLVNPIPMDSFDHGNVLDDPPILTAVLGALTALSQSTRKASGDAQKMKRLILKLSSQWKSSLSMLNEFIRRTGETGFRMPTVKIYGLEGFDMNFENNQIAGEEPMLIGVSLSSISMLFRQMPRLYIPSANIIRQPHCESKVSSVIQRFYAGLLLGIDVTREENRLNLLAEKGAMIRIAMGMLEDESVLEGIIRKNLHSFKSLLSVEAIRVQSAGFDDIIARNLRSAFDAIQAIPELFGFTRHISLFER